MAKENHDLIRTSVFVKGAVAGDSSCLELVVSRFHPLVIAHIQYRLGANLTRSGDAEDLAQDVWFIAIQKLRGLKAEDGQLANVLVGFLSTTSTFLCNNFLRKKLRRGAVTSDMPQRDSTTAQDCELDDVTVGIVTRVARKELKLELANALDALAPISRAVLVLRLLEQQNLSSIATTLNLEPAAVTTRYRDALYTLRQYMAEDAFDSILSCSRRR